MTSPIFRNMHHLTRDMGGGVSKDLSHLYKKRERERERDGFKNSLDTRWSGGIISVRNARKVRSRREKKRRDRAR